jgi:membrane associated rhomboid family serine protease
VFIGGIFCLMVAHSFGQLRGWMLILASGVLGNAINAAAHYPEGFLSLGASTATFGAVGLLVGMAIVLAWRSRSYRELKPVIVPVAVGLTVLGWYGVGGENTDVFGHVFGWTSGIGLGLVATSRMKVTRKRFR